MARLAMNKQQDPACLSLGVKTATETYGNRRNLAVLRGSQWEGAASAAAGGGGKGGTFKLTQQTSWSAQSQSYRPTHADTTDR